LLPFVRVEQLLRYVFRVGGGERRLALRLDLAADANARGHAHLEVRVAATLLDHHGEKFLDLHVLSRRNGLVETRDQGQGVCHVVDTRLCGNVCRPAVPPHRYACGRRVSENALPPACGRWHFWSVPPLQPRVKPATAATPMCCAWGTGRPERWCDVWAPS